MEISRLKLKMSVSMDYQSEDEYNKTSKAFIARNSNGDLESKWRLRAQFEDGGEWKFEVELINYKDFKDQNVVVFGTANVYGGADYYEEATNKKVQLHELYLQNLTNQTVWHFEECYGGEGPAEFEFTADITVNFQSKLQQDFGKILEKGVCSDIILIAEGKEFNVHKVIVTARSAVFEKLLKPHMKKKTVAKVQVEDVSSQIFQEVLKFMYTGAFTNSGKAGFLEDLFVAAEKFEMADLKKCVAENLLTGITAKNVKKRLKLAEKFGILILKKKCEKFLKKAEDSDDYSQSSDNSSNDDNDDDNSSALDEDES